MTNREKFFDLLKQECQMQMEALQFMSDVELASYVRHGHIFVGLSDILNMLLFAYCNRHDKKICMSNDDEIVKWLGDEN